MTVQGYVVSQLPFFLSAELKNLRLWVDAASQNAWDTGKSYLENLGWVVRKPVNANPGLKVNQGINFSCLKMFFTFCLFCSMRLLKF